MNEHDIAFLIVIVKRDGHEFFLIRIHGDRSFHCDVCGVCLDVQLRGNHKCREGSAHDECCICLEVLYKRRAFLRNGQILVHYQLS